MTDSDSLVAALLAAGPLDNQTPAADAEQRSPYESICASIVASQEPTSGVLIHEAVASQDGRYGVVLVYEQPDGSRQARLYGTGDADPATGGCPLIISGELPSTIPTSSLCGDDALTVAVTFVHAVRSGDERLITGCFFPGNGLDTSVIASIRDSEEFDMALAAVAPADNREVAVAVRIPAAPTPRLDAPDLQGGVIVS